MKIYRGSPGESLFGLRVGDRVVILEDGPSKNMLGHVYCFHRSVLAVNLKENSKSRTLNIDWFFPEDVERAPLRSKNNKKPKTSHLKRT